MSPLTNYRVWIIGLGTLIVPLDSTVNVAFPDITRHFAIPAPDARLLVVAFILTSISLMLIAGRIGDLWGHRRVFQTGLAVSAAALLLVAVAPSYGLMVGARVLQGAGAALIVSCSPALVIGLYPEGPRGPAVGAYVMIFALGTAVGPVIGGWLVEQADWRAVFWFRAPLAVLALAFSFLLPTAPRPEQRPTFDLAGAALLGVSLATTFGALNLAGSHPGVAAAVGAVACIAIGVFVRQQSASAAPIINLSFFRSSGFAGLNVASVLVNMASFSIMLLVPFYLPRIAGLGFLATGLAIAAYPAGIVLTSSYAGRLLGRVDDGAWAAGALIRAGTLAAGAGLWLVSSWDGDTAIWLIASSIGLVGAGLGLYQASFLYIVTGTLPPEERGVAGSLAEMTRSMGNVLAATVLFELFRTASAGGGFLDGFGDTYAAAAAIPFCVLAVMLVVPLVKRWRQ